MIYSEYKNKIEEVGDYIKEYVPRILKSILSFIAFSVYCIVLLWVLLTNIVTLAILYIGVGASYLSERFLKWVKTKII